MQPGSKHKNKIELLNERSKIAEEGGGTARLEKQRASGKMTARERIDFFLDEESMKIQADTGEFVNRKGVYPPLADADKIKFVQMYTFGKEDFETKKKEYQKIFFQ